MKNSAWGNKLIRRFCKKQLLIINYLKLLSGEIPAYIVINLYFAWFQTKEMLYLSKTASVLRLT